MISKPTVIQIAEQVNNKSGQLSSASSDELMKFTLQPGGIGAAAGATSTNNASSNQTTTQQASNSSSPSPSSTSPITTTTSKPMEK
jgi:hypothetical protein